MARQSGYVYLVECNGYFKAGKATSVENRINQLQTGSPYEIKLVASFKSKDYSEDERRIHELLSDFNVRGEWFAIPSDQMGLLHEWFKPLDPSIGIVAENNNTPSLEYTSFAEWISKYKGDNGYENLIQDLFEKQLFAFHFIRQEAEYVIEQAVKAGDDYTLFYLYHILVDKNFVFPSKEAFESRFIETIERFKLNMSWLAALSAAIHCFY